MLRHGLPICTSHLHLCKSLRVHQSGIILVAVAGESTLYTAIIYLGTLDKLHSRNAVGGEPTASERYPGHPALYLEQCAYPCPALHAPSYPLPDAKKRCNGPRFVT